MVRRRLVFLLASTAVCSTALATPGGYPTKPIELIVPWPPAGGPDIGTRAVIPELEKRLGQSVIVENRPGANSITGTLAVSKAVPDGYTLLSGNTAFALNPSIKLNLPYDPGKDFTPIAQIGSGTGYLVVVNPKSKITSIPDLIAQCRKSKCYYGSAGIGNSTQLAAALFSVEAGSPMKHIPYPGVADAMQALLTGEVTVAFVTPASSVGKVKAGDMRAIAFTGETPLPELPNVPLMAQFVPSYRLSGAWLGLFAPAGVPSAIVQKLNSAVRAAEKDSQVRQTMDRLGYAPSDESPSQFAHFVRQDIRDWAAAAKAAGLKPE